MFDHNTEPCDPTKTQTTPLIVNPTADPSGFRELCHSDPTTPFRIVYPCSSYRYSLAHSFFSR